MNASKKNIITIRPSTIEAEQLETYKNHRLINTSSGAYKEAIVRCLELEQKNLDLTKDIEQLFYEKRDIETKLDDIRHACAQILDKTGQTSLV